MELRRDALFGTVALLSIMAFIAFGTIGLIARMRPEIHRILEDNVTSTEAAGRMLVLFARAGGAPLDPSARESYKDALAALEDNITEPGERRLVESLKRRRAGASSDDAAARLVSIADLEGIIKINRAAMARADARAQQLGVAGAWAVVLMALVAMFISYVAIRRLDRRVIAPVIHLHRVLEQAAEGEAYRRCHERGGARELEEIYEVVNDLLDHRLKTTELEAGGASNAIHGALVRLLDERSAPTFVLYRDGELLAANARGLEALTGEQGGDLREALRLAGRAAERLAQPVGALSLSSEPIEGASAVLASLSAPG